MANFKYVVQDPGGKTITGVVEMPDRADALALFRERNYRVVSVDSASAIEIGLQKALDLFSGIGRETVILFTRQLSTLVHSGLPLAQALESLAWQERNQKFRIVIETLKGEIEKGKSVTEAFARYPALFSNMYLGMIQAGEAAGILDEVLDRLSKLGLQELEIRTKLQAAFTYPIILVLVALAVMSFLMIGAIPKFLDIFRSSQAELPLATQILLGVSEAVRRFWYLILLAAAGVVIGAAQMYRTPKGRFFFDRLILRLPVFGDAYLKIIVARLTRSISALTKSGIPLLRAIDITKGVSANVLILDSLEKIRTGISQGKSITELFQKSGIFPPMVVQMVSVGETTGKLDEMLSEVSDFYDLEIEYFLRNLTSSLEPILLLGMGLMVGFIALAVLMPVFNLVKVFRQ
jgi:type IV pilus assembly protein PilC